MTARSPLDDPPRGDARMQPSPTQAELLALALEEVDYGVLILDAAGALRHANRRARLMLAAGEPLRLEQGRTILPGAAARCGWEAALQAAWHGQRTFVSIGSPQRPSTAAIGPLQARGEAVCGVLALIGRRDACDAATVMAYARLHRLTEAETRVLSMLGAGLSPVEISKANNVTRATVLSQVRSVYAKTGVHSVRRLLVDLAGLPPMRPSLLTVRPGGTAAACRPA